MDNSPVIDGFPHKGSALRNDDVSFEITIKKRLNKQYTYQWFENL